MRSERLVKRRVKIKSGSGFLDAVTYRSGEDGSAMQPVRVSTIDIRPSHSWSGLIVHRSIGFCCPGRYSFCDGRIGEIRPLILFDLRGASLEGFCDSQDVLVDVVQDAALMLQFPV